MKRAPDSLRFAALAVDVIVFGFVDGVLSVLVSPVSTPYYANKFGFIGGLIDPNETAEESCARILKAKGNLEQVYFEQLATFSAVHRDKRNRVVSVAYLGFVRPDIAMTYKHETAMFVPVSEITSLAYDHNEMLSVALKRLSGKLAYTTIAQFLLPRYFTLTELQSAYESILITKFDKRNFRKKILSLTIIKDTGRKEEGVKNRPATLYTFTSQSVKELPLITSYM
jgi:8-oxo-dGTP diphosphatase